MLPKRAEDQIIDACLVALTLARAGDAGAGYEALCLASVDALGEAVGETWEDEARDRWKGTLERYTARWNVARA